MQSVLIDKQSILKTVQSLPDKTSIEEAMERLFLLQKIQKGIQQADEGKTVSHSKVKEKLEKWLA